MGRYKAYIFDMDGTVLNTLEDLCAAMNHAMKVCGHRHDYTTDITRFFFGSGVTVSVSRALAYEAGHSLDSLIQVGTDADRISRELDAGEIARAEEAFRPYYQEHCNDHTAPYPGIPEAIRRIRERGILTAVVSNKPDGAVQTLVRDQFEGLFDYSLGEKAGIARKPAPDMVNACLNYLGVLPEEAVYIGDSEIDLETAANAGLDCIAVTWGFRSEEFLKEKGATMIVTDAASLL